MQGIADALTFAAQQQVTINQRQRLEIDGRPYYFDGGGTLRSITPPQAGTLNVATLTGLVDYIQANPDSLYLSEMVLHVGDNRHVHLRSPLVQPWRTRETLVTAQAMVGGDDSRCPFERFRDPEDAILWLNANVVPDDERDELLQALAAIDVSNGAAITDDGISQTVALKTGARLVERGALKNRITLRPYSTFCEIEQPSRVFVLRLDKNGRPGLFSADGDVWIAQAMASIRGWLKDKQVPCKILA